MVCHWPSGSREGQWFAFGGVDPCEVHAQRGWAAQCLIHGAVALGGGYEGIKVFGRGIALAIEAKPDRRKTGESCTVDAL